MGRGEAIRVFPGNKAGDWRGLYTGVCFSLYGYQSAATGLMKVLERMVSLRQPPAVHRD